MSELKDVVKKKSLDYAEKYLAMMLDDVVELAEVVAEATDNPFDDAGVSMVKLLVDTVKDQIDKIDGEVG